MLRLSYIYKGLKAVPSMLKIWGGATPSAPTDVVAFAMANPFIQPAQVPSEFLALANVVAAERPKVVLEIGTYNGGTLFAFCRLADASATIISLDLPGGKFGGGYGRIHMQTLKKFRRNDQNLHFIRANSHELTTAALVKDILGTRQLDMLFIDGDHSYEGVKQDFNLYSPLVRRGGVIAFHDIAEHNRSGYGECEVSRFWNEIKNAYSHREFVENRSQGWAGIGVIST